MKVGVELVPVGVPADIEEVDWALVPVNVGVEIEPVGVTAFKPPVEAIPKSESFSSTPISIFPLPMRCHAP